MNFGSSVDTVRYTYIDINGCKAIAIDSFGIDACEGIIEVLASTIHLYPNPNKGSFTLQTSGCINSDYTISDMLGHIIARQTIRSDNQQVDIPEAAEGVYTLSAHGAQPIRFVIVH